MDPLSVTASIIAVFQLTSDVIKYLIDVKDARNECQKCKTELLYLLPLLMSLKYQVERTQSGNPWLEQLRILNFQDGPLDQYRQALEMLLSRIDIGEGIDKFRKRLLWRFTKEQVAIILERIERLKGLVNTALTMNHTALSEAIEAENVQAENSNSQSIIHSVKDYTENILDLQIRDQCMVVLKWLSTTDYSSQQQDIIRRQQKGTAQWFLDSTELRDWRQGLKKTLYCPGKPGAGKTMMAAIAVDYLTREHKDDNVGIAYVFCDYKAQVDQTVTNLISALLKQLGPKSSATMSLLSALYDKHLQGQQRPLLEELVNVLSACLSLSTTYVIIDALDECSNTDGARDQLLEILLGFEKIKDVRLFFTSRFLPELIEKFRLSPSLEVRASEEDLRCFIQGQVARLPSCVRRDETLQKDVVHEIALATDGTFLLAWLFLDSISVLTSPEKIRAKLKDLRNGPEVLENAYKDAIARIEGQPLEHRTLAKRALCWISYAQRQLTTQELRIALAIEPYKSALNSDNLDDLSEIVSFCAGLIVVDQESSIIRLVHYTAQEYLEHIRSEWAPGAQLEIAVACLSYLSYEEFKSGGCTSNQAFEQRISQYEFFDYSARYWNYHMRPVEDRTMGLASDLFRDGASFESIMQVIYTRVSDDSDWSCFYPRSSTALHLVAGSGSPWLFDQINIAECLKSRANMNMQDSYKATPLYYASEHGDKQIVELLINNNADLNMEGGYFGSALTAASHGGYIEIVRLLLNCGATVNSDGSNYYGSALQAAAYRGHFEIAQLLLDKGAEINSSNGGIHGSALQAASLRNDMKMVLLLLSKGADIDEEGGFHCCALQAASFKGHTYIVKLLLDEGADVDKEGYNHENALEIALSKGHTETAILLLDKGAKINAKAGQYLRDFNITVDRDRRKQ